MASPMTETVVISAFFLCLTGVQAAVDTSTTQIKCYFDICSAARRQYCDHADQRCVSCPHSYMDKCRTPGSSHVPLECNFYCELERQRSDLQAHYDANLQEITRRQNNASERPGQEWKDKKTLLCNDCSSEKFWRDIAATLGMLLAIAFIIIIVFVVKMLAIKKKGNKLHYVEINQPKSSLGDEVSSKQKLMDDTDQMRNGQNIDRDERTEVVKETPQQSGHSSIDLTKMRSLAEKHSSCPPSQDQASSKHVVSGKRLSTHESSHNDPSLC